VVTGVVDLQVILLAPHYRMPMVEVGAIDLILACQMPPYQGVGVEVVMQLHQVVQELLLLE